MPALLTALQAAGFGVRGSDGALLLKPAEPSQGLVFENWEVRLMAESAQHGASLPLTNLAEVLNSPLEELKDAPMASFILGGIKTHAQDKPSPLRFWAQFIVELGRQAQGHEKYDLLDQADPAKVQLDPVQLSFILRRLMGDLYSSSKSPTASTNPIQPPDWWGVKTAYAGSLACTLSETTSSIMDVVALGTTTGFGALMGYLGEMGMTKAASLGKAVGIANIVGTYARLIWVYAAFDLKIELKGDGPLLRTRAVRPAYGEQRSLSATVKLNIGQAQTLNCFRIMLNAAGLDFSLPNDGPIKGAHVQWQGLDGFNEAAAVLHGGPEQIVRFVDNPENRVQAGGITSTGENAVTNQATNENGEAFINVEGVGQKEELGSDAKQLKKLEATVQVNVQIQPANIFQGTLGAVNLALGGLAALLAMPADLMYRTRWAFGGGYALAVLDWQEGGGWQGTITSTRKTQRSDAISSYSESFSQKVTVTGPATIPGMPAGVTQPGGEGLGMDMLNGTIGASYNVEFNSSKTDEYHGAFEWGFKKYCTPGVSTQSSKAQVEVGGKASIILVVMPGGQVSIVVNSSDQLVGVKKNEDVSNTYDLNDNDTNGSCRTITRTVKSEIPVRQSLVGINISTTVDPKNPDVLKGSKTETSGDDTTTTIAWNLSRN